MKEIIRTFKKKNFELMVYATEDHDTDLSWDESGEVRKKIDTGELECFSVRAELRCRGVLIGCDTLCGCTYKSPSDFQDHFGMRRLGHGSYFSDMVRSAIDEGRKTLFDLRGVIK